MAPEFYCKCFSCGKLFRECEKRCSSESKKPRRFDQSGAVFLIYERATGFAPVPKPWKGFVLLLHYARGNSPLNGELVNS